MHVLDLPAPADEDTHQTSANNKTDVAHICNECQEVLLVVADKWVEGKLIEEFDHALAHHAGKTEHEDHTGKHPHHRLARSFMLIDEVCNRNFKQRDRRC